MRAQALDDRALAASYGTELLRIAARAVRHGIDHGRPIALEPGRYAEPLRLPRASFVTLQYNGALQGCVGTIAPHDPLAVGVARHAHWAAFHDHRFDPVQAAHWPGLAAEVSILSPREPLLASAEESARAALRPGVDGLVFQAGTRRAVFLPKVWEDLPEPRAFLGALKRKAGLDEDFWSPDVTLERFTCAVIPLRPLHLVAGL